MDNLHFTFDLEYNPSCDTVGWYDRNSFDGTHFIVGPVHGSSHAETEVWFIAQLRDRGIMEDVWLQDNRVTEHFVVTV